MRKCFSALTSATLGLALLIVPSAVSARSGLTPSTTPAQTPIQHLVVIFGENISFDHYFGTYPHAANPPGQPRFTPLLSTPAAINNLLTPNAPWSNLLTNNPNCCNTASTANDGGASNPFRLNRTQALTASMNHSYTPEQSSFDQGRMDLFPKDTGTAGSTPTMFASELVYPPVVTTKGLVMGYYDGNTVTAMWNYAQHFAMSDNSYNSNFGPSTPGALNLIAGQTNGIGAHSATALTSSAVVADGQGGFTLIGDADPLGDTCSTSSTQVSMTGVNIGDLLSAANVSWGWFQGGFDRGVVNPNGSQLCSRSTVSPITGNTVTDYVPHHQPFQFYATTRFGYPATSNPTHTPPTSPLTVGLAGDPGNHQYDTHDFFDALAAGNLPAVSFLKAPAYQNAHPANSNPLDEQAFVVNVVNALEGSPFWANTAVIIAYDDSDGWYDHQQGPMTNASFSTSDTLSGTNACGIPGITPQLPGPSSSGLPVNGRCSPGVRTPLMVISPWAKPNFVDHTFTIQSSITQFIEQNWTLPQIGGGSYDAIAGSINSMFDFSQTPNPPLFLSPITGQPQ